MNHLEEGLLHAWLDAETTSEQDEQIQTHLENCDACATLLDAAARDRAAASELIADLELPVALVESESVVAPVPPPGPTTVSVADAAGSADWMRPLAWAASLVLAVALGWYARAPQELPRVSAPDLVAEAVAPEPASRLAAGEDPREEAAVSEDSAPRAGSVEQSVAGDVAGAPVDRDNMADAGGREVDANAAPGLDATGVVARKSLAAGEPVARSEQAVALEEAVVPLRQESLAGAMAEAEAEEEPRAELSATAERFRQARPAAAPLQAAPPAAFTDTAKAGEYRASTVGIRPLDAAMWLGGDPVLPEQSEVLAVALEPALELAEAEGGSPVVAFRVRLSDGSVVQIWQQNVAGADVGVRADDELDEPSEALERRASRAQPIVGATSGRDARDLERASLRIGELLVVVQGEGARRILESMAAGRDSQR